MCIPHGVCVWWACMDQDSSEATFNEWLTSKQVLCDLPSSARALFNVTTADGTVIGWCGCYLFTHQRVRLSVAWAHGTHLQSKAHTHAAGVERRPREAAVVPWSSGEAK